VSGSAASWPPTLSDSAAFGELAGKEGVEEPVGSILASRLLAMVGVPAEIQSARFAPVSPPRAWHIGYSPTVGTIRLADIGRCAAKPRWRLIDRSQRKLAAALA
jgi:hypothetical protein